MLVESQPTSIKPSTLASPPPTTSTIANNLDMNDLIQQLTQHLIQNPNLAAALGPAANHTGAVASTVDNRWRLEEVGIFEPDLPVDEHHLKGDVITVSCNTIYHNVMPSANVF